MVGVIYTRLFFYWRFKSSTFASTAAKTYRTNRSCWVFLSWHVSIRQINFQNFNMHHLMVKGNAARDVLTLQNHTSQHENQTLPTRIKNTSSGQPTRRLHCQPATRSRTTSLITGPRIQTVQQEETCPPVTLMIRMRTFNPHLPKYIVNAGC